MNNRPENCRDRLQEEGKPYPKSGCYACVKNVFSQCVYADAPPPPSPPPRDVDDVDFIDNLCGCGRPGRYATFGRGGISEVSCNKYSRCPSYDELRDEGLKLREDMRELIKAANDLSTFKESTGFYTDALTVLREIEELYK